MTRILIFLLPLYMLAACAPSGACGKQGCTAEDGVAVTCSQQTSYKVLEFSFCNARSEIKEQMLLGPFRLHGVVEEYTCCLLLPPFCSSVNNFQSLYSDGFVDAAVAMYSDRRGFFAEHSPCWRLRVMTTAGADVENIILEVNYSYFYEDAGGNSGFVEAMQRLPLRAMAKIEGDGVRGTTFYYHGDDSVPFSVVCLCFASPPGKFYPL